jgi:nitric oxide reductase large subunit
VRALLFLAQTLVGGASQHYRAEIADFFGVDLAALLPFNVAREGAAARGIRAVPPPLGSHVSRCGGILELLGAGIFGFLINLPIVSYYQIGTALTANHGHAAMMGVYGMLAVALALFAIRYLVPPQRWSERLAKVSFWSLNIGLGWMVFATLFPVGVLQLYRSVTVGYFEARQLEYVTARPLTLFEWWRLPGDALFIVGGACSP